MLSSRPPARVLGRSTPADGRTRTTPQPWESPFRAVAMLLLCVGVRPTPATIALLLTPWFLWQLRRHLVSAAGAFLILATALGVAFTMSSGGSTPVAAFMVGVAVQGVGLGALSQRDRIRVFELFSRLVLVLTLAWVATHVEEFRATWTSTGVVGWSGHKNLFGYTLALALVPCVWPSVHRDRPLRGRLATLTQVVALFALVVTTRSSGALAVSVVVVLVGAVLRQNTPRSSSLTAGRLVIMVAVALVVLVNLTQTVELFGRDPTITGRTEVWTAVVDRLGDYAFVGDGPGTNWRGWSVGGLDGRPTALTQEVWDAASLRVTSSHDSALELAIVFGVPIALAIVVLFARSIVTAARFALGAPTLVLASWTLTAMIAESFATTPLILLGVACVVATKPEPPATVRQP